MRKLLFAALVTLTAAAASAQTNPIVEHYRAYQAAIDHGDLATAEREAEAALQASEQRDGDSGHTAALALNLAVVRLSEGHAADALAPAQRARGLAETNSTSGVDVRFARLVEAHAAFLMQQGATPVADAPPAAAPPPQLIDALAAMRSDDPWGDEIFSAAADLAQWQFAHRQYHEAAASWEIAVGASSALPDAAHVKAATQVKMAGALIMQGATERFTTDSATKTRTALVEALNMLSADLHRLAPSEQPSTSMREYAAGLAWYRVFRYLIDSQHVQAPNQPAWALTDRDESEPHVACKMTIRAQPLPQYPAHQSNNGGVGAVTLYWETDDTGAFRRIEVIAAVGADFADSVRAVMNRWRMVKAEGSSEGCTMQDWGLRSVNFQFPEPDARDDTLINAHQQGADQRAGGAH
jgi:hypothetical protein